ncbi:hypothetical protein MAR_002615 [Mya arenaria]|uniref:Uncharacterized protein n=1 Tax=Mya arenaria TaxID=6604 RepID=A0ABY7G3L9_MYAAR|nr:hypothetical protein MAR_002615 [Mya arenaria]
MGLHEEILLLMQIPAGLPPKKTIPRCDVRSLAQLADVVDKSSKNNDPVLYKKTDGPEPWALYFKLLLFLPKHLHFVYETKLNVKPAARCFAGSRYSKIPLVPFLQCRLFRCLCKTDIRRTRSMSAAHEVGRSLTSGNATHSNACRSYCRNTTLPEEARAPVCATSGQ